ncbi:arabinose isomerase [Pedobacter heparinus]|uniref:Putative L-arabinose isomerase protein n=1 Tax=Pedobacter heparinus (strain ATCC 13125 / DSM 2366 / CIP 104194 / JCM 7457 / NBRC 12017 / NCIMB 9290 / NRRL B-14731 / HIM 762-3) TaxID=485917 RepID=C6XZD8_PEDHD|nr:arabinose isomerase [Pedobacter heparinus]ACU04634.1 putative L-arabinose isomerase protein [Pedobacter heparinus DSM 2366]
MTDPIASVSAKQSFLPNNSKSTLKIGLFGIGLDTYWPQFEGLKKRLEGYLAIVEQKLGAIHPAVLNAGLVDSPDKAFAAGRLFKTEDVDVIFLHVTTYALSSTVLPVVQRAKVPVIILNLSPEAAIDYTAFNAMTDRTKMTGEWLSYCSACPVPEIANVFNRTGIKFHQITGMLQHDPECWNEITEWVEAAKVANMMFYNRMGCMGHYYSGMLDIYSDLTQQYAHFGGHIELLEVEELASLRKAVTPAEMNERLQLFYETFDVQKDCAKEELEKAAVTSVALDRLADKHQLGSMAYYYKGTGNIENEEAISSIILGNSLLTARGIPVAGEYEIKNAQAMKIMDCFGAGGSFTEYYAMDFNDDVVLMGHDGPGHIAIAEGKTKVRPLGVYHGKVGKGVSVEMSVKNGPVTLLSVVEQKGGSLMLLVAEAEAVPGPILQIGNTNSRYKFPVGARNFVNSWNSYGPAHHCAIGLGHISSKIEKLGQLLNMDVVKVC